MSKLTYRPDIDGLRAVAVIAVLVFHAFPEYLRGGFIGVDIFFVISGFLISTIILEDLGSNTFKFSTFYARRIKRIFPPLIIVLVTSYSFGWFFLWDDEFKQLGKHMAGSAAFVSNYMFWNEAGYFDNSAESKPLLHLWSLGIEEQFYLLWPLAIWLAWKSKINCVWIVIIIGVASFCLSVKAVQEDAVAAFYAPQSRFWELAIGGLLASISISRRKNNGKLFGLMRTESASSVNETNGLRLHRQASKVKPNIISFVGFLLLIYGAVRLHGGMSFPGVWALVPVLGTVLIISAGPDAWLNKKILSSRIAVWFGLISYPLYLWHWPLLSFAAISVSGTPSPQVRIGLFLASIALAWATYRIEKPIRFGAYGKSTVVILSMLMILVGYMGYHAYDSDGYKDRFSRMEKQLALHELFVNPFHDVDGIECATVISEFAEFKFDGGCKLTKNALPKIMFIGDSHAAHFRSAIWEHFTSESVLMVSQTSCFPFSTNLMKSEDCEEKNIALSSFLKNNTSVDTVYLSGFWAYLLAGEKGEDGDNWRSAGVASEEDISTFKVNAEALLKNILDSKKNIVFIKDIPTLDFNIKSCFLTRPHNIAFKAVRSECSMSHEEYLKLNSQYDLVVSEVLRKFPSITIYDPQPLFCDNKKCVASDGASPYYLDGDHVNHYGADMVIKDLIEKTGYNKERGYTSQVEPSDVSER